MDDDIQLGVLATVKEYVAQFKQLHATMRVTDHYLNAIEARRYRDESMNQTILHLAVKLMGRIVAYDPPRTLQQFQLEEPEPDGRWQFYKLRLTQRYPRLKSWLRPRFRFVYLHVTFTEQKVEHWHLCPWPDGVPVQTYYTFLTWSEPFLGSMQHYQLEQQVIAAARAYTQSDVDNVPKRLLDLVRTIRRLDAESREEVSQ